ncbi:MAG: DUF3445 domain-containing protein [Acidobacteria bacterium]|nr:DUF3445 domain-containing protein [Acidobacteriota bacterium]
MTAPEWLDELQVEPGPPWHAMGTRSLDLTAWLIGDDDRDAQLAYKRRLLAERHDVVSAARRGCEAAAAEAAALMGAPDLEGAALLVQEDLCVLVRREPGWCLDAGVVCFPSMWSLRAKLGRPMAEIHGPVPAYAEELGAQVDRFLDRLDRPVWRRNWFIHGSSELHQPEPPPLSAGTCAPEDLWLRSERQALRRLPSTGALLFTIRTQQAPLVVVPDDLVRRLAAAVRAWPPELVAYRSAATWRDVFLERYDP